MTAARACPPNDADAARALVLSHLPMVGDLGLRVCVHVESAEDRQAHRTALGRDAPAPALGAAEAGERALESHAPSLSSLSLSFGESPVIAMVGSCRGHCLRTRGCTRSRGQIAGASCLGDLHSRRSLRCWKKPPGHGPGPIRARRGTYVSRRIAEALGLPAVQAAPA